MKLTKENFMLFNDNWALVTAGSLTHYNTMTISWGSLGCIWNGEDSGRCGIILEGGGFGAPDSFRLCQTLPLYA